MKDRISETMKITGAISVPEMIAIWLLIHEELRCEKGVSIDLGSFHGKSSYVAAAALVNSNKKLEFYLVDTVYRQYPNLTDNILEYMKSFDVSIFANTSLEVLENIEKESINYVFIDSSDHLPKLIDEEMQLIQSRIIKGGLVLFHDYGGQFNGPYDVAQKYIKNGGWEQVNINWERIKDIYDDLGLMEKDNDSFHKFTETELPMYLGCIRRV